MRTLSSVLKVTSVSTVTILGCIGLGGIVKAENVEVLEPKQIEVIAESLNLRSEGSTKGYIKKVLKRGELLELLEDKGGGFIKVRTVEGEEGWVSKEYVKEREEEEKWVSKEGIEMRSGAGESYRVLKEIKEGEEVELKVEKGEWSKVKYEGRTGWVKTGSIEKQIKSTSQAPEIKYYKQARTELTVREGKGTETKKVGVLKKGEKVGVYKEEGGWSRIEYKGRDRYVFTAFLDEVSEEAPPPTATEDEVKYYKEAKSDVNIREGASTGSRVLGVLGKGEKIGVYSEEGGWTKVEYKGGVGYISTSYLKEVEGNPTEEGGNQGETNPENSEGVVGEVKRGYTLESHINRQMERVKVGGNVISSTKPRIEDESVAMSSGLTRSRYIPAEREDIEYFINPTNFRYRLEGIGQFLKIDEYIEGITEWELNSYLNKLGKENVFYNQGGAFIRAAKANNIELSYLVAHAMWETGFGKSQLAKGVEIKEVGGVELERPVKVYNFFGIGAIDGSAVSSGAEASYKNGWTTIENTIMGSAKWISKNYIHSSKYDQDTLYEMKWNYEYTWHQYATDVNWCNGISKIMKELKGYYGDKELKYEVPVYK